LSLSRSSEETSINGLNWDRNRIAEEQSMPKHFDLSRRGLLALGACALARRSAAGDGAPFRITMGKSVIEVSLPSAGIDLAPPSLITWVTVAARAVTVYYGVFPTATATVTVNSIEDRAGVLNGTTYGGDPPRTRMGVGQHTTTRQLENDWTMTHEFVHLAFPDMTSQHHWLEEGQATYIEPIARAQIGTLTPERVWGDMMRDMHQGLPGANDRGLDFTRTWGRTYWGGALYCLLADVGIRERTGNRAGLQQALRGVLAADGNIEYDWPIEEALRTADKTVKVPVMTELYDQMKDKPFAPDLNGLWQRLGVELVEGSVRFRDDAPLAEVRKAITRPVS
jgi:hypothetical protein